MITSATWFAVTGGVGAVLVPWWLTGWRLRHPLPYWSVAEAVGVLLDTIAVWVGAAAFVRWYEEPALAARFGADYEAYRRAVPAWRPRLRP